MGATYLYMDTLNHQIYSIYDRSWQRQIIDFILKISMVQGVMAVFCFLCVFIVGICSVIESCIIQSCLPEFKGTYDEDHDAILAIDWEIGDERL